MSKKNDFQMLFTLCNRSGNFRGFLTKKKGHGLLGAKQEIELKESLQEYRFTKLPPLYYHKLIFFLNFKWKLLLYKIFFNFL